MLEILINVRDAFMASIMSWLGFGADIPAGINDGLVGQGLPFVEINDSTCPPSSLDKVMGDASGA